CDQDAAQYTARTSQQCFQSRHQLFGGEGFYQVVIRTMVQSFYTILDAVAGGEDQNRDVGAARPNTLEQFDAISVRQAAIQNHCVIGNVLQRLVGLLPATDGVGNKT